MRLAQSRLSESESPIRVYGLRGFLGLLVSLFVVVGVVLANGYRPNQEINLVPPILATLDPTLYRADFFVQEMLRFAPRAFTYLSVSLLVNAGLSIAVANMLIYVAALASFLAGLKAIASLYSRSLLPAAILMLWSLTTVAGDIGDVALFPDTWRPSTCAMAISIWGIYFSLRRSWVLAFLMFGLASIPQFLVGVLPAMMFTPLFLADIVQRKEWRTGSFAALVFLFGVAIVLIPMLVLDTTSTDPLSSADFVEFYAFHRVPQHLVPSSWPLSEWVELVLFYVGGLFYLRQLKQDYRELWNTIVVLVSVAALGLVANFVAVEVWPVAFVAKLHLARMTPFAALAILVGLLVRFAGSLNRRDWVACAILAVAPISHIPGAVLLLLGLAGQDLKRLQHQMNPTLQKVLAILLAMCLYRFPLAYGPNAWPEAIVRGIIPVSILLTPFLVTRISRTRMESRVWSPVLILAQLALAAMLAVDLILYPMSYGVEGYEAGVWVDRLLRGPLLLAVLTTPFLVARSLHRNRRQPVWIVGTASVVACTLLVGLGQIRQTDLLRDRVYLERQWSDPASSLARQFKLESPTDALVLVPPFIGQFQLLAQRSVVVSYYGFPFSDNGIIRWHNRMQSILGPPGELGWALDYDRFATLSSEEVVGLARQYNAGYVLSKSSWHPGIEGQELMREHDWVIWQIDD